MKTFLIKNARIVNEQSIREADVLIQGERIAQIGNGIPAENVQKIIDAAGKLLMPGIIDDQVHFREPGLTHKGNIYTESRAAVAGGITSYMEMPNTIPNTLTQELLEKKYAIARNTSLANYSFYMGASNDNLEEVLKTDSKNVCGVKVFMGSSTGNMLVDNPRTLEGIFSKVDMLIATHCEDEATIQANMAKYKSIYGENVPFEKHPEIRSREACLLSSSLAVRLAKQYGSRLHVLHISTADELSLFDNSIPLAQKKVTAEACMHHLWFCDEDYEEKNTWIKWNPAIKSRADRDAILAAVLDNRIDVVATDHAPHTREEKSNSYFQAPSGGPLVQHSLVAALELYKMGKFPLTRIAEKMSHHPAILFDIVDRGFIREGYFADLVLVDPDSPWTVNSSNILYKCGWSPFDGQQFSSSVTHTFVSGHLAYENGRFDESVRGQRLTFQPD
ncbi:MAG: dihydroorotase [Cyclobacteriaceae bacterium]|nr:dihydroorotase [Cyclobacteriaceae bacterium]